MRARYLVALEHERYDQLPGRAYARAFLRTYASALGLHADRFVAEFDEQMPELEPVPAPVQVRRRPRERLSLSAAVVLAGAVLVGIAIWNQWGGRHQAAAPVQALAAAQAAQPPVRHHVQAARKTIVQPAAASRPLVVRALSGPCWVLARRGGPTGPVLFERTLQPGETARFHASHVWLRLGAPANVDVRRGTHVLRGLPGGSPANVVA